MDDGDEGDVFVAVDKVYGEFGYERTFNKTFLRKSHLRQYP
jgi:hypothetical protein